MLTALRAIDGNEWAIDQLRREVAGQAGVVPFVGAGISKPLGFPLWVEFLSTLAARAGLERTKVQRLLAQREFERAASELVHQLERQQFGDAIRRHYGDERILTRGHSAVHDLLTRLPKGPVVTTNFDRALEAHFEQAGKKFDTIILGDKITIALNELRQHPRVLLKLHGDYADARILTLEDYEKAYGSRDPSQIDLGSMIPKVLRVLLSSRRFLFLGCSLDQDRTMRVLREVAKDLHDHWHYAIVECGSNEHERARRGRFLSQHNIRPIWYPAGAHDAVAVVLEQVVAGAAEAPAPPQKRPAEATSRRESGIQPVGELRSPPRVTRALHLHDLRIHATTKPRAWWSDIAAVATSEPIDFVVITGDVTLTGTAEEYRTALACLAQHITPLVGGDRARVMIVPGELGVKAPAKKKRGAATGQRQARSAAHPRDAFFAFLDEFYDSGLDEPHQRLGHTTLHSSGKWSAHVFPEHDVSFYGFDAHYGDTSPDGALIDEDSLNEVDAHSRAYPTRLRVAVWQYGLLAQRGARNFMSMDEASAVFGRGFQLALHGQAHTEAPPALWERLQAQLPIMTSGPFGGAERAGPANRSRQFSIIELMQDYGSWRVYERSSRGGHWKSYHRPEKLYYAPERPTARTRVRQHRRTLIVEESGIATLTVELQGVTQVGSLPLAQLTPGFTNCRSHSLQLKYKGKRLLEPSNVAQEGGTFWLKVPEEPYDELTWVCHFSNGHAIDARDIACGMRRPSLPLQSDEDAVVHEVQFDTDRLILELRLPHDVLRSPTALSQRRECISWISGENATRLQDNIIGSGKHVCLEVIKPRNDHRYGFSYRLANEASRLKELCCRSLEALIRECRGKPVTPDGLFLELTDMLGGVCETVLGVPSRSSPFFVGRLWNHQASQLMPAFGRFPPETWGATFRFGAGVAGHAFRFGKVAFWQQLRDSAGIAAEDIRDALLLYRHAAHDGEQATHNWIIEVPLLLDDSGVVVGTIGFADGERRDRPPSKLDDLAIRLAANESNAREALNRFSDLASGAFWQVASRYDSYARTVFDGYWSERRRADRETALEAAASSD